MLPAIAPDYELADLDWFRVCHAPLLEAQTFRAKHHKLSVRCEGSRTRVGCWNLESDLQRFALDHRNGEVVLGEEICAVRADREVRDVALELWREFLLPHQSGQFFGDVAFAV